MFWPNSRSRRNVMNFGDKKTQISNEAVPAIRTSPTGQRLRHGFEADAARGLDEHDVAAANEPGDHRSGLPRVGGRVRLTVEGLKHEGRERPHGDKNVRGG